MIKPNTLEEKLRNDIISFLKYQHNKKYIHNTYGPDTFDCAGFVWYVYNKVLNINSFDDGYGISTTTKIMTSKYGKIILFNEINNFKNTSLIKKGDILLFHTQSLNEFNPTVNNKYPGHCGIYIGNNKFMHASNKQGKVVYSKLEEDKKLYKKIIGYK